MSAEKKRPYTGRAVENGKVRFSSITQIKLYDPLSDGCPRKWAFQYKFGKRLGKTDALDKGIDGAGSLEHYLKTGENVLPPVLQPALKYFPEPRNPMTGELDLEVEEPLGDIVKAVYFRDQILRSANETQVFRDELLVRMQRFAGLTAKGIPLDGAADYRHHRGFYKNEEGIETAEHPSTRVVEIGDLKMISRIKSHKIMKGENAGKILPGWAKTSAQVCDDVQMVSYSRHSIDKHPDATHIRPSHVYGQKSAKGAAKRTGLISVEQVLRRFERVENLVGEMVDVATADRIEDIQYNSLACDSFTHVVLGPDGLPLLDGRGNVVNAQGCGHRYYCPLPTAVVVQNLLGQYKESAMSLFDKLPPGVLSGSSDVQTPSLVPPVPTTVSAPLDATAERAAVEEYKKKLRAEDEARASKGTVRVGCGAPGCGVSCSPGYVQTSDQGFVICSACKGVAKRVGLLAPDAPDVPEPPAPPPPPPVHPMAVTPPDAPPPAPLINAAVPLPPAAIAEITDPALKATVEEHAKEHARLQAEKEAAEAAAKQAAGTSVWCGESNKVLAPTMDQALAGKFVCTCTKEYSLKSLKQEDGTYLVKRHKPVNKPEAPPAAPPLPSGDDDEDGEEELLVDVSELPPEPPAPPAPSLPPAPPSGEMTQMVNDLFGSPPPPPSPPAPPAPPAPPQSAAEKYGEEEVNAEGIDTRPKRNGSNGSSNGTVVETAPAREPGIPWSTPTVIMLLRSIDASMKEMLALVRAGKAEADASSRK